MGIAVTGVAAWSLSAWQASAAVSADESTFVSVSPVRILDTREDIGLAGPFVSPVPQDLKVTGSIPTKVGTTVVVPDGATGVVLNVTVVGPTADGFLSIRPADASGAPTTSSLNFSAGDIIPNSVTVQVPTSGADIGKIEITYNAFEQAGPTTEILVDLVGYTKNAGLASLQAQVNELQAIVSAATAPGAVGQEEIGTGAVGSTEIASGAINNTHIVNNSLTSLNLGPDSVGLSELNATIDDFEIPPDSDAVANGQCSVPQLQIPVTGATAGSQTLVLLSRLTDNQVNLGWAVRGLVSPTAGQALVEVCNYTGDPQPDQPGLTISYILLGA
jgi:hypothetical protein